jgi:hypothetical protein
MTADYTGTGVCESCGDKATVQLADGSLWCRSCDESARAMGTA